jgi:Glycosyltransferase Family 4
MRVLITNGSLGDLAGTQVYVRDLAAWLLDRGHSPVVYGPDLGETAAQLRRVTVPVTDDLATIGAAPDVIHGNSAVETMAALLHFSSAPAIFVCHSWRGTLAKPPRFPRLLRYVAVDDTCADRLLYEEGIPADAVTVLLNGVDTARFAARTTPLPPRPRRALVFSNTAHATTHHGVIREACARAGIEVDVIGSASGTAVAEPETVLGDYDLVFAKAKCALEAMASGAAVILCDVAGMGGMVRAADVARLRRMNFGARALRQPLSADALLSEIESYDAADAAKVSEIIRRTAPADVLHEQLLALYETVIAQDLPRDWEAESRAAAAFLQRAARGGGDDVKLNLVVQATHRLLDAPVIGRALTRGARWLVGRGRSRGK